MTTIIYSHPWDGSYNKAILDRITTKLESENKPYQVIDLHKDGFDPVMTAEELAMFGDGETPYALAKQYQDMIRKTTKIVFIFPVWWSTIPAILKGFFDKVMLKHFAYLDKYGWEPLLKIDKTLVISTSDAPTHLFNMTLGEAFFDTVFKQVGFNNTKWMNKDKVSSVTDESRKEFLQEVEDYISEM